MAYIGNTPADKFLTLTKQSFSTSATTSYTLDSSISSTQDIALFINNVRQSPVDAYTVSGTALTLTSATAGTDEMYCVYLGKTVGTVSPSANSVTNAMLAGSIANDKLAGSIANSKLANSSITLNGSAVSLGGSATVGGTNDNLFKAYRNGGQTLNHNTATKVQLNAESFDIDSKFDSSTNYRYTPASVGYYHLSGQLSLDANDSNLLRHFKVYCYKNGSELVRTTFRVADNLFDLMNEVYGAFSVIDYSSSTSDYYEMYAYQNNNWDTNNCDVSGGATLTYFQGYKLIT